MRIVAAFILLLLSSASVADDGKKLIWGNIPFVRAGNYYEFDAELSKTRAAARGEALDELAALLIPLASSSDDVAHLARALATTVMQFDDLVRRHADQVHQGIPTSLV